MRKWSWPGAIVLVMALAISIGWAAAVVVLLAQGEPISPQVGSALSGLGGAMVAIVAGYLGRHYRDRKDDESGSGA
jgi:hypothetical protein